MSGTPTEAEVQTQWRAVVDMLEDLRNHADGTIAGAGGQLDVLQQALEGQYTPVGLANAAQRFRGTLSTLIDGGRALEFLTPVLYEYARLINGGASSDPRVIMRALYEHFDANTLAVESRDITYDTSATAGSGNVGTAVVSRLTLDENGYRIENVTVETKRLRCVQDQNNGVREHAEVWEVLGAPASPDALQRPSFGSGSGARTLIRAKHAGSDAGGSWLNNSSFSDYSASASPKFSNWTESAGGASLTQDTTNYYRSHPGASVNGSLKITGGAGTVTVKQALSAMRSKALDPFVPMFFRVMVNKTIGTASGGDFIVRIGAVTVTTAISSLASGWTEVLIPLNSSCWLKDLNANPFDIEIEWASSTSGYLLVDDAIFVPFDFVDGTWWVVRQNVASPTSSLINDTLDFTDTGGAPATAKIQYWLWIAGLGYLPSTTGTPSFTEP
jgi:hypothetical protein